MTAATHPGTVTPAPREDPLIAQAKPAAATRRSDGFTLIEIMAVVVIMGMLMTVLAVGITGRIDVARIATTNAQIQRIEQALEFYQLDNARYPTADQGLSALYEEPTAAPVPRRYTPGGYLKREQILDPWGTEFEYTIPGTHNTHAFDIWSLGPDGQQGTDDIANWSTGEESA